MLMLDEFQTAVMVRGLTDAGDALDDVNAHGAEGEASAAAVGLIPLPGILNHPPNRSRLSRRQIRTPPRLAFV